MRVEAKCSWFKFSNASVYQAFCLTGICSPVSMRSVISIINVYRESYFLQEMFRMRRKTNGFITREDI